MVHDSLLYDVQRLCLKMWDYVSAMGELFGIKFAPLNIPLERRLQTLSAAVWIVTLVSGGMIGTLVTAYVLLFTRLYFLVLLYAVWMFYDKDTCEQGGRSNHWVRNWRIWHYFRDYFPLKLVKVDDAEIGVGRNYLFCMYPHGVLSTGAFFSFATDASSFKELFPGMHPHILTLKPHFFMPLFREYALALGGCAVNSKGINALLSHPDKNKIAVLIVGGAAESLYCRPGQYKIILKKRKGFVRLALQNGSPLVPVFSFGETDIYNQVNNPDGSLVKRAQDYWKSITGIAPVLPIGRGFFQYSFGVVPQRRPVTTVVGKPIEVPRIAEPSREEIFKYHTQFKEALVDLFEAEKHKYIENADKIHLEII